MVDQLDLEEAGWEGWYEKDNLQVYKRERKFSSYRIDTIYENTTMETILDSIIDFEK